MTLTTFESIEEFYDKGIISRKEYLRALIKGGIKKNKALELIDFADGLYLDDVVVILLGKNEEFLGYELKYKKDDISNGFF